MPGRAGQRKPSRLSQLPKSGGFRINPKAKLNPSQVQDLRWLGELHRALMQVQRQQNQPFDPPRGLENFPFQTMQQRMQALQQYERYAPPGAKRPDLYGGSFPHWLRQMLDQMRRQH